MDTDASDEACVLLPLPSPGLSVAAAEDADGANGLMVMALRAGLL